MRDYEREIDETERETSLGSEVEQSIEEQHSGKPPGHLLRLLWPERRRLGKAAVIGLLIGLVVAVLIPNSYEATVQLMPPDSSALSGGMAMLGLLMGQSSSGLGGGGGAASSVAGAVSDLLGGQQPGQVFIGILSSRTIADRLIDRFDLRKVYWRKTYKATREKLDSHTDISEAKKSGIITIAVTDHDRDRSAAMAQAYVDELNRLLSQVNTSSASRERAFLEQRLLVVHKELDDAAKQLSEFSSKNTTFDPDEQSKAIIEAAATLQGELIAAQAELSAMQQIYTPENVRVRSMKAHVAELQDQLDKFGGKNYKGSAVLDPNDLYPPLKQLPILGRTYAELYERAKINEKVYELLTEAYELARVQEAKETPSVKVLDAPEVPEKKSWPPRTLLTLLGGVLGFAFACCWIMGREYWHEVDAEHPYKSFLAHEFLPVVQPRLASAQHRWSKVTAQIRRRGVNGNGSHNGNGTGADHGNGTGTGTL